MAMKDGKGLSLFKKSLRGAIQFHAGLLWGRFLEPHLRYITCKELPFPSFKIEFELRCESYKRIK